MGRHVRRAVLLPSVMGLVLVLAGCGGGTQASPSAPDETDVPGSSEPVAADLDGGTITVDGEVHNAYVECQLTRDESFPDVEASANAFVTTPDGVPLLGMDFNRFSAGTALEGDHVELYLDVASADETQYNNVAQDGTGDPIGTVTIDGTSVTARDLTLTEVDGTVQVTVSFDLEC